MNPSEPGPAAPAPLDPPVQDAIKVYEDAAIHVAYVAEDFLHHGDRSSLEAVIEQWHVTAKDKDAAIARLLERTAAYAKG